MSTWMGAGSVGTERRLDRIAQRLAGDGGHFARHAEVAPQVGTVGDGLVVDLDDAVGRSGEFAGAEFDNAGVIAIDAEFRAAGQHAVAFDAVDDLLAERHVDGDACPARQLGAPQTTVLPP